MVRAGYKQTEVGEIPEDWDFKSLGPFVDIASGESPSRFEFSEHGIPYFKVEQLNNSPKYTSSTPYHFSSGNTVPAGSIIFAKRGASILLNKIRILSAPSFMDTNLMALSAKRGLYNEYLYYCLDYRSLAEVADTTSIPQINNKHITPFYIPFPKPNEQKAIAEALSDVDGLIGALEKQIAKKRDIKTATMQQLLTGKKRLPGYGEGKGYKQTELGRIPEDWDVKKMSEIGHPIIGLTYSPNDVSEDGTLVLRSSNIQQNKLAFDNNVFVKGAVPSRVIVEAGDLLICVRNGSRRLIGKCALIDEKTAGSAFGAFMSVFRSDDSEFIFHQFQSNIIQRQIEETMGATINQITNKDMNSFLVPFPEMPNEREKISCILREFDGEIDALNARLIKTKAIKQGMMQELLTGRTRLI